MNRKFIMTLKSLIPEVVWNPIFIVDYRVKKKVTKLIEIANVPSGNKWVDVGCGLRPYETLFPQGSYFGVDVEKSGAHDSMKTPDFFYDGNTLPFELNSVDGIICTQVLEHVPNARKLITEMARIIKLNGSIILSLPFVWQEHEEPYDFARFSSYGISELLTQAGFEVEEVAKDTGAIETIAILSNVYIINNLVPKIPVIGSLFNILICFPIQLLALLFQRIVPDEGKLFLNLIVKAKKVRSF